MAHHALRDGRDFGCSIKEIPIVAPGSVTQPGHDVEPTEPEKSGADALKPLPGATAFLGMGLTAAVCVGLGVLLGVLGDSRWHTSPVLLVVGLVVGLAVAVMSVVSQIRRYL